MQLKTAARSTFTIHVAGPSDMTVSVREGEFVEHASLGDMWIAGRLFGGVDRGRKLSRSEMVARLRDCGSLDELRDAASGGFGAFHVILLTSDRLSFLSSASSGGVFYTLGPEARFSDNELSLRLDDVAPVLHAAEALRFVIDNLNLSPHRGLFEGVHRAPGATLLSYDRRTGNTATRVLMPDGTGSDETGFDRLVDCCAEALADELREQGRFPVVYWSGGIDGLVWLIALAKAGIDVTVIHGFDPRSSALFRPLCRGVLARLPSASSVRVIVADGGDDDEADAETTMLSGLMKSNYLRPDYRLKFADLALARTFPDADHAVVVMGFGIDGLYSFRKGGEGLSSTNGGRLSFYWSSLVQYGKYLGATLRLKDALVGALVFDREAKARLSFGLFCDSTADTKYLESKSACRELRNLYLAGLRERFDSITRVVTGVAGRLFGAVGRPLNASLKLAGYFNNDSVHALRFRDQGRHTDSAYELPYLYTPLVRFFANRCLGLSDLVTPKSLLHGYVRANLGASYNDLLRRARAEAQASAPPSPPYGPDPAHEGAGVAADRYRSKLRTVYARHRDVWRDFAGLPDALGRFLRRLEDDLSRQDRTAKRPGRQLENFVHLTAWLDMNVGCVPAEEPRP